MERLGGLRRRDLGARELTRERGPSRASARKDPLETRCCKLQEGRPPLLQTELPSA